MAYKRIFQLNPIDKIESEDLIPIDRSGSSSTFNVSVGALLANLVEDAPKNEGFYVRQDGGWVEIATDDIKAVALSAVKQYETKEQMEAEALRTENAIYVTLDTGNAYYYGKYQDEEEKFNAIFSDNKISSESLEGCYIYVNDDGQVFLNSSLQNDKLFKDLSRDEIIGDPKNRIATMGMMEDALKADGLDIGGSKVTSNDENKSTKLEANTYALEDILAVLKNVTQKLSSPTVAAYQEVGTIGGVASFSHEHGTGEIKLKDFINSQLFQDGTLTAALLAVEKAISDLNAAIREGTNVISNNGWHEVTHIKSNNVHQLTNVGDHKYISFYTKDIYNENEIFSIDGKEIPAANISTSRGEPLDDGFFVSNKWVTVIYDKATNTLCFPSGGSSSGGGFIIAESSDNVSVKNIWINSQNFVAYVHNGNTWVPLGAVYK